MHCTGIATARVPKVPYRLAVLLPGAAGAKVGGARYHCKFRDLGWPYLCTARLYRIREIDKQVHVTAGKELEPQYRYPASDAATSPARRVACLLLGPDKSRQQVPWLTAAEPAQGKQKERQRSSTGTLPRVVSTLFWGWLAPISAIMGPCKGVPSNNAPGNI